MHLQSPRPWRRVAPTACGLALVALTTTAVPGGYGTASAAVPAAAPAAAAVDQPHILLGVTGGQLPVMTTDRLDRFEAKAERTMATVRMYALWDSAFPDTLSTHAKDNGQTLVLSVRAKTKAGKAVPYTAISGAAKGSAYYNRIVEWAQMVKAFEAPMFFTFQHEPEAAANDVSGTAAQYKAAWQRIVTIFREQGVRNAEYTFIATAYGFRRMDKRHAGNYYPGDAYVDDIAADAYNWFTCRPGVQTAWAPPKPLLEPFRQFGLKHPDKGLIIGELGTVEDPQQPGRKAAWYREAADLLAQPEYSQVRAVAEWYKAGDPGSCNWEIDTSASSLDAFQAWAADPRYSATSLVPSTPRQVLAKTGTTPRTAQVSWAPAGPGGSPVTGYTVTVAETGETITLDGNQSSYVYQPAAPTGSTYSFTVSATNATGTGGTSARTAAVALR